MHRHWHQALFILTGLGLGIGGAGWFVSSSLVQNGAWAACIIVMLTVLLWDIARNLRHGEKGVDALALLTMAGALLLGQYLVGAVIAFMLSSGRALEEFAARRARGDLTTLLANAPHFTHRYQDNLLETVDVNEVQVGDRLLIGAGDIVPVDGILNDDSATLDDSALTGESALIVCRSSAFLRSGSVNSGQPFEMEAVATAANSTYAAIVHLVEQAQSGKAPFTRMADRYAFLFMPLALFMAGLAWLLSHDAVRGLAVLVVATPCPLILAVPVAIVSGISRAARRGILIKSGGSLEAMSLIKVVLFDKTGTLTRGAVHLCGIETHGGMGPDELLRLAASVEQISLHVSAQTIVAEAHSRGLQLSRPEHVMESPGEGIFGTVDGLQVVVGGYAWIAKYCTPGDWAKLAMRRLEMQGQTGAFVAVDNTLQGVLLLQDDIRLETPKTLRGLRQIGIQRIVMVSGDRADVAETIATALGIDSVLAERSPIDKVAAVEDERVYGKVLMVGDGINDAPALAAADVGVAMGVRGATASSEAADAVLMVDRIDRLPEGISIARRTRLIAWQSVIVGMGLSVAAMFVAAWGYLPPVWGALLQELIDVAVIINALRALTADRHEQRLHVLPAHVVKRLRDEHALLYPVLDRIGAAASAINSPSDEHMRQLLVEVATTLKEHLLPHEQEDEKVLYPQLESLLHGVDPMAALSRTHREIFHLARLYGDLVAKLPLDPLSEFELYELRRLLFSLSAILRLHFAQEEELFKTIEGN